MGGDGYMPEISSTNPTCMDLFLTNSRNSFKKSTVISAGISDFHEMIVTVLKTTIVKGKPRQILYRDYKNFTKLVFNKNLASKINATTDNRTNFKQFQQIFLEELEKQAPIKKKIVRANQAPYMTKSLRKAIMTRSGLQNKYHKLKTEESLQNFKKQRNFCNRLYIRERKKSYSNLNPQNISDNKFFGQISNHFFPIKEIGEKKLLLLTETKLSQMKLKWQIPLIHFFKML